MLYISKFNIRRQFNEKYFNNKAQIGQTKDEHSKVDMCLLDKNRNPLYTLKQKNKGKYLTTTLICKESFKMKTCEMH